MLAAIRAAMLEFTGSRRRGEHGQCAARRRGTDGPVPDPRRPLRLARASVRWRKDNDQQSA